MITINHTVFDKAANRFREIKSIQFKDGKPISVEVDGNMTLLNGGFELMDKYSTRYAYLKLRAKYVNWKHGW